MQPIPDSKRRNRRLRYFLLAVPALLLIPLIAMQFTDEVNWGTLDFLVMGLMLSAVAIGLEVVLRRFRRRRERIILALLLLGVFLLAWAELAVGIFGTWFAGS